jgi:hypothetical protein
MKHILTIITICIYLLVIQPSSRAFAAQKCSDSIPATSPDSNFTLDKDGTANQNTTGLMWMRCALGQEWNGSTCRGTAASFSWADSLKAATLKEFAGYSDWRLPNKNELLSIVEDRCVTQAINAKIFPATPSGYFWSSSPYAALATGAWSIDFGYGIVTATEKSGKLFVRLVRVID